ncbi:thiopurine S-methyltransferase [Acetobacter syzygii]|uniref:thiopurine S-methyltransferase n=1 Tax=Acetobacter syzygii TaxID=146476 RepID=UPI0039E8CC27
MNAEFWLEKWARNEIGFHAQHPHKGLVEHFSTIFAQPGGHVFVPLCGKTLDIQWLLNKGFRVTGVELSLLAVEQLFAELGVHPVISPVSAKVVMFEGGGLKVFVADIFSLSAAMLGSVDIVYDRAALVALPQDIRVRYAKHLMAITRCATQFLICVEYDQCRLSGPPFAVMAQDIADYYAPYYEITSIEREPVERGIKGREPGYEHIWLLCPLNDRAEK